SFCCEADFPGGKAAVANGEQSRRTAHQARRRNPQRLEVFEAKAFRKRRGRSVRSTDCKAHPGRGKPDRWTARTLSSCESASEQIEIRGERVRQQETFWRYVGRAIRRRILVDR